MYNESQNDCIGGPKGIDFWRFFVQTAGFGSDSDPRNK